MLAFWVVEKFDIIKHILASLDAVPIGLSTDPLPFEELKETLRHSIVMTVSATAHAGFQIVHLEELLPLMAGILAALIRMDDYL